MYAHAGRMRCTCDYHAYQLWRRDFLASPPLGLRSLRRCVRAWALEKSTGKEWRKMRGCCVQRNMEQRCLEGLSRHPTCRSHSRGASPRISYLKCSNKRTALKSHESILIDSGTSTRATGVRMRVPSAQPKASQTAVRDPHDLTGTSLGSRHGTTKVPGENGGATSTAGRAKALASGRPTRRPKGTREATAAE